WRRSISAAGYRWPWPAWRDWLAAHRGGERRAPAKPGNAKYKAIEAAPGRYVKERAPAALSPGKGV
ncbi:MAG: hypothetical protein ACWGMT_07700, partial [Burkholderiales bacterium]